MRRREVVALSPPQPFCSEWRFGRIGAACHPGFMDRDGVEEAAIRRLAAWVRASRVKLRVLEEQGRDQMGGLSSQRL